LACSCGRKDMKIYDTRQIIVGEEQATKRRYSCACGKTYSSVELIVCDGKAADLEVCLLKKTAHLISYRRAGMQPRKPGDKYIVDFNGVIDSVRGHCSRLNLNKNRVYYKISCGMTPTNALRAECDQAVTK
jgi:hypothetical protein